MNIFLDLEETIIEDWFNPFFLENKIEKIKKDIFLLKEINDIEDDEINLILFSFAVTNKHNEEIFIKTLKKEIEEMFNSKFIKIYKFNKEFIFSILEKSWKIKTLPTDMISDILMGNEKETLFEIIALNDFKNEINILFDDTVKTTKKEIFEKSLFSREKTTLITIKV